MTTTDNHNNNHANKNKTKNEFYLKDRQTDNNRILLVAEQFHN